MRIARRVNEWTRDDSGAAIIEFALVAPLLLVLVWGIIETGRAFYTINSLASAVRDGARYGAAVCPLSGSGAPAIDLCRPAITNVVTTAFQPIGPPLVAANVQAAVVGTGQDTRIQVTADYPYAPIVPVAGWNLTITRRAVFRYERLP